ncbi:T9SS type A sorting domain-containing protein [Epilithonimonas ginsengisoli]|uniref:T9SS type A sorting domain-containing protein n=1 Tax=Epilithonimonas ginsengisoli TaxID=1245592 RepID=A0ABU4JCS7_9FLAO|nr:MULTISPECIES: T9SS type A sorting domain-containing protein [Chryseobacterium group]MBV6878307.1 T9SS type A sorting domain-containing protein [Epilithonimonas sp. FP105]MDW8547450.1 T9SS type A sorting domain-containing protein [Epilithonimonas ginsengisoli]OAH68958.1 hypothetical protein AXA65_16115 [Chryseobacterium sp. FP211-J200]
MKYFFTFLISLFSIPLFSQNVNADVFEINYQTGINGKNLFKYKDKIIFTGDNINGKDNVIWAYDFSTKKSFPVKEIVTGWSSLFSSSPWFSELNDKVYFTIVNSPNNELWTTDATTNGTYRVFEFPQDTSVFEMKSCDNNILYIKTSKGLYVSDGTTAGTKIIPEIKSEIAPGIEYHKNHLVFAAKNPNFSNEMWASVGNETFRILDAETNGILYIYHDAYGYNVGDKFIFYAMNANSSKEGLWSFDINSKKATFIYPAKNFTGGVLLNDKLVYKASNSQSTDNLWATDGTSQNTISLNTQKGFTSFSVHDIMMKNGNYAYFFPHINNYSNRLWRTDGTLQGTSATDVLVDNYAPNIDKSFPLNKNLVIRNATYNKHWLLDESENLIPITDKMDDGVEEAGKVIFPFTNRKYGREFFQYSFNSQSIVLFHDGKHSSGSNPKSFNINSDNKLIFTAGNAENGNEFYSLEDKNSQPQLIKDFDYNGDFSYGIPNGTLFKVGNYYYQKPTSYTKTLAKTDGTFENTKALVLTGNDNIDESSSFGNLKDNTLIFTTYSSDVGRTIKVWKTENSGTELSLLKELPTSGTRYGFTQTILYNGFVYFMAENADNKLEVWRTDGTTENTTLAPFTIPDTGNNNNIPVLLTVFDNKILINKDYRLWTYDGLTNAVKEIILPTDTPFFTQINVSIKPEVIDGKLYLLSQNGYGTVYKFDDFQNPPVALVSDNRMSYVSEFQKCGNQIYFATGPFENRYNAFWSLNPESNTNNLIFMNDYSNTNRVKDLACVNNYMYYLRENSNKLFRTSGTAQSITTVDVTMDNAEQLAATDSIDDMFLFDGHLYFVATTAESGSELFHIKTDLPTFLSTDNIGSVRHSNVTVSPNPTADHLKIYSKSKINKVEMYDYSGVKIGEYQSDNLDLGKLSKGVYLIKIYTNDFIETKKVIKK